MFLTTEFTRAIGPMRQSSTMLTVKGGWPCAAEITEKLEPDTDSDCRVYCCTYQVVYLCFSWKREKAFTRLVHSYQTSRV